MKTKCARVQSYQAKHPAHPRIEAAALWFTDIYLSEIYDNPNLDNQAIGILRSLWANGYIAGYYDNKAVRLPPQRVTLAFDCDLAHKFLNKLVDDELSFQKIHELLCDLWDEAHCRGTIDED
jgi:hypothetical protein